MNKLMLYAFGATLLFSASCKKGSTSKTTCSSTLYGFATSAGNIHGYGPDSANRFGIINQSTAAISALGTFSGNDYENQAAYNSSDNCYYVFGSSALYKINATSGAVTALTTTDSIAWVYLKYNSASNKLYCFSNVGFAQITTNPSTFSLTTVAHPVHPLTYINLAADNATGDMYFVTGDTTMYYIEKYHSGSLTVVDSISGAWEILGMQFNTNDNMLYAIKIYNTGSGGEDFIKINPSTGITSTIVPLSIVNPEFYSTCIDPCNNHFIISTVTGPSVGTSILDQFSMTGTLLQSDTTTGFLAGLDVN